MKLKTKLFMGAALTAALVGLGLGQSYMEKDVIEASAQTRQAPAFEVDPFWPQPLPNEWILGNVIGVAVDARDHVYIVHRAWGEGIFKPFAELGLSEGTSICCEAAPPIVEFDPDGYDRQVAIGRDGVGIVNVTVRERSDDYAVQICAYW